MHNFHQTCPNVALCAIALSSLIIIEVLSPEVLRASFCWCERPHDCNFISLSPAPCTALLRLSRFTVSALQVWLPRGAGKIWNGNKQGRRWWCSVPHGRINFVLACLDSQKLFWKEGCKLGQSTLRDLGVKKTCFFSTSGKWWVIIQ